MYNLGCIHINARQPGHVSHPSNEMLHASQRIGRAALISVGLKLI